MKESRQIAFRVDASTVIGTGHFMRCLTLADSLKTYYERISFISRHMPEHFQDMIRTRGYSFYGLGDGTEMEVPKTFSSYQHWLGVEQDVDAEETIKILVCNTFDTLIIDHYALDYQWEKLVRNLVDRVVVIDDLANRRHDCDVLLDQNYYKNMDQRYLNLVPSHCKMLLGPRFALLRNGFQKLRRMTTVRAGAVERILIFFGGVDIDNFTGKAISALTSQDITGLDVDVVIGEQHPFKNEISQTCHNYGFTCHIQTQNIENLMASADLSIGAGGTAAMERCCLGLPTMVVSTADNQLQQVSDAAEKGLIYLLSGHDNLVDMIQCHLKPLLQNDHLRRHISRNGMMLVDGKGALRVARHLLGQSIKIREADPGDLNSIYEWRNNSEIRAVSREKSDISFEEHKSWFATVIESMNRILLIGTIDNVAVGVVRFDICDECAEVSIYRIPGSEKGLGLGLLLSAEKWLRTNRSAISLFKACVLENNMSSHKLFANAGYLADQTIYSKRVN